MYQETTPEDIKAIMKDVFNDNAPSDVGNAYDVLTEIEQNLVTYGYEELWKKLSKNEVMQLTQPLIRKIALQREIKGRSVDSYSKAELDLLSVLFERAPNAFKTPNANSQALSLDEIKSLLDQGHYGQLDKFTSAQAKSALQGKKFTLAALAALSDNKSYFFYDVQNDVLCCYIAEACHVVKLYPNENGFEQAMSKKNERNYAMRSHYSHCYLLYLAMQGSLDVDNALLSLFGKKDQYQGFFDAVVETISNIFREGLNNAQGDLYEKVKALFVQANSYRIVFLSKELDNLQALLSNALADKAHADIPAIFEVLCRIVNNVEALRHNGNRNQLITLLGLNEGHTYIVNNMPVIGCDCACFKEFGPDGEVKSWRYYFYDFQSRRFVVIKVMETDYFISNRYFFDTYSLLSDEKNSFMWLHNAFITNNKVKNSQYSEVIWGRLNTESNKELYHHCARGLYDIFAYDNFEQLMDHAYQQNHNYFERYNQTSNIYLVKVKKLNSVSPSYDQTKSVELLDYQDQKLEVLLLSNNNSSQDLTELFAFDPMRFNNFYMLLQCPIVYGKMRPSLLSFFGLNKTMTNQSPN